MPQSLKPLVLAGLALLSAAAAPRPCARELPPAPSSTRPAPARGGAALSHSPHGLPSLPPQLQAGGCAALYPAGFALISAYEAPTTAPALERPQKGVGVREPTFGTCLVRATDRQADYPAGGFLRNDYSRRQAFNADGTRYLAFSPDGYWHLYDAYSFRHLGVLKGLAGDAEPQWHPSDPRRLDYLPLNGGTVIDEIDVRRGTSQVVADLKSALPEWGSTAEHIWTKSEGSPSADARYWGFQVENGKFELLGFMVWDQQNGRIVGTRQSSDRPDHVSMSPSGRWFTVSSDDDGTWAWSPDFTQKKKLHHKSEHSDLAVGADGHDLYVSIDYQSNGGDVFYVDVDACPAVPADARSAPECPRTVLFQSYVNGSVGAMHFSGKAYDRPGWVLVSTYGTTPSRSGSLPWFANKIFALELKPKPRALGIAYHRSIGVSGLGYWSEPQATVDRRFRRIQFSSSWLSTSEGDIEAYQVLLPEGVLGD